MNVTAIETGFDLSARDKARLKALHPDLVRVVEAAAQFARDRFMVIEGLRTEARQKQLVRDGASRTMNSRHLTGHAVDLAPLLADRSIPWNQWWRFAEMAEDVKRAAQHVGVPIEWGGDWPRFKDGPHFQLPRDNYPA